MLPARHLNQLRGPVSSNKEGVCPFQEGHPRLPAATGSSRGCLCVLCRQGARRGDAGAVVQHLQTDGKGSSKARAGVECTAGHPGREWRRDHGCTSDAKGSGSAGCSMCCAGCGTLMVPKARPENSLLGVDQTLLLCRVPGLCAPCAIPGDTGVPRCEPSYSTPRCSRCACLLPQRAAATHRCRRLLGDAQHVAHALHVQQNILRAKQAQQQQHSCSVRMSGRSSSSTPTTHLPRQAAHHRTPPPPLTCL